MSGQLQVGVCQRCLARRQQLFYTQAAGWVCEVCKANLYPGSDVDGLYDETNDTENTAHPGHPCNQGDK